MARRRLAGSPGSPTAWRSTVPSRIPERPAAYSVFESQWGIPIHVGGSPLLGMYQRRVSSPPCRDEERPHTFVKRACLTAGPTSRGDTMPTVIGRHDVKDKDHWLASPKRQEVFGPLGVTNIRTFVDPQNPTQVAVLMDVADMDVLMAAMQSEAMAEAMAYDGVLGETLVILVEA